MDDIKVAKVMKKMVEYFHGDAKRIQHAIKVHSFSRNIALLSDLKMDKLTVLEITALLHDIGIHECERKYNSTAGHYQEIEGPHIARSLLNGIALEQDDIDRITYLIGHHHSYHLVDGIDFQILIEADFLVNYMMIKQMKKGILQLEKYFRTSIGNRF